MSVLADAGGEHLTRAAGGFLNVTQDFTVLFWSRPAGSLPGAGQFRTLWELGDAFVTPHYFGVYQGADGAIDLYVEIPGDFIDISTAPDAGAFNQDYPIAVVYVAATKTWTLYVKGVVVGTAVLDISAMVPVYDSAIAGSWSSTTITALRQYQRALTQAEIQVEWSEYHAVSTANLFLDCPFVDTLNDLSGAGRHFTAVGAPTFVTGGPLNQYPYTARIIPSLPYSMSQHAAGSVEAVKYEFVYFKYVPTETMTVAIWYDASTNYHPSIFLQTVVGPQPSRTSAPFPRSKYYELVVGREWLVALDPEDSNTFPGTFTIHVEQHISQVVPKGSLAVNDDGSPFPTAFISATSDVYTVLKYGPELTHGEKSSISNAGILLLSSGVGIVYDIQTRIYDSANGYAELGIALHVHENYVVNPASYYGNTMTAGNGYHYFVKFDQAGTILASWGIGYLNSMSIFGDFCVNNAETVLVFRAQLGAARILRTINLLTNTLGPTIFPYDGYMSTSEFVTVDDNSFLTFIDYGTGSKAGTREFTVMTFAGVVLRTFTLPIPLVSPRIARDAFPDHFWIWDKGLGPLDEEGSRQQYYRVRISDGVIVKTINSSFIYSLGTSYCDTEIPAANAQKWSNSDSCPMWVTMTGPDPPIPPEPPAPPVPPGPRRIPIRRLRRAGILSAEGADVRHDAFQLSMQVGIGNVLPPGVLPDVVMQYSDDAGTTWSDELRLQAGPMGAYTTEVRWTKLGTARNRVYQVWMTDPVFWVIIGAYLDAQKGRF